MNTGFFNSAESVLTYAATVAELLLLVRLAWLGLIREFKIFSCFLAFDAFLTVALMNWDYHSASYEWIWGITSPTWTLLLAAVALELSGGLRRAFPQERGNRTIAFYGFLIGMTVSVGTSMLAHPEPILRSVVLFLIITRRCILTGCVLAILAQGAYLTLGSAPLRANWRKHRRILLPFITCIVIDSFAATSRNTLFAEWLNLVQIVCFLGCFCAWIVALRPAFSNVWDFPELSTDEQLAQMIVYNRCSLAKSTRAFRDC